MDNLYWDSGLDMGCATDHVGYRRYKAKLMNIPWGYSWEKAFDEVKDTLKFCKNGHCALAKSEPIDDGIGIYGLFDIPDENCQPKWGTWTKMNCSDDDGKAIAHSKLDAKVYDWEKSCAETKLSNFTLYPKYNGEVVPDIKGNASGCINTGIGGEWAEIEYPDSACKKTTTGNTTTGKTTTGKNTTGKTTRGNTTTGKTTKGNTTTGKTTTRNTTTGKTTSGNTTTGKTTTGNTTRANTTTGKITSSTYIVVIVIAVIAILLGCAFLAYLYLKIKN